MVLGRSIIFSVVISYVVRSASLKPVTVTDTIYASFSVNFMKIPESSAYLRSIRGEPNVV